MIFFFKVTLRGSAKINCVVNRHRVNANTHDDEIYTYSICFQVDIKILELSHKMKSLTQIQIWYHIVQGKLYATRECTGGTKGKFYSNL